MPHLRSIEIIHHVKIPTPAPLLEIGDARCVILTGPNGCGKTIFLKGLAQEISFNIQGSSNKQAQQIINNLRLEIQNLKPSPENEEYINITQKSIDQLIKNLQSTPCTLASQWNTSSISNKIFDNFKQIFLPSQRQLQVSVPKGPTNLDIPSAGGQRSGLLSQFLVNQHVQARLAAQDDPEASRAIFAWLDRFDQALGELLDMPGSKIHFDRHGYTIALREPSGQLYDLNKLASGHSSLLQIFTEILFAFPQGLFPWDNPSQDFSGVVLIDEIENHLHLALQRKILPFLMQTFPFFQFVIATHSPAVISSVDDALVVNLKTMEQVPSRELRGVPYGRLMTDFFDVSSDLDLASERDLGRLGELDRLPTRTQEEEEEYRSLAQRLLSTSQPLALEVWNQIRVEKLMEGGRLHD
jgi:predicted ATPase